MLTADPPPPEAAPVAPPPEAPPAPAGPKLVGVAALKEIPHEGMNAAYTSGEWAPRQNEQIPVSYDGKIGRVSASRLQNAVEHGAEIVHPDVLERATLEKRYGEHGTLGATVAGAARGLTLGLSDPIAVEAADAVGGEAAKAAVQDRLSYYRREHPVASTVGEVGGMIAPALLTGGASADVEGAGLLARGAGAAEGLGDVARGASEAADVARGSTSPSFIATAARALGAPTRMLGEAGKIASRGAEALTGAEADSLLGRMAQKAVQHAASAGTEGAILGGAQELDESSIDPNHTLTAEKLFSAMGHGAILNAAVGGALGGAGEGAGELLEQARTKASPFLSNQAGERAWKAVAGGAGGQKLTEEAEARVAGGVAGAGRVLLEAPLADGSTVIPTTGSLASAALTPEKLLERITDAKQVAGEKIGSIVGESGAKVRVADLDKQIEGVLEPLRAKAGFEPVVKAVEDYRDSLYQKLGVTRETIPAQAEHVEYAIPNESPNGLHYDRAGVEKIVERAKNATGKKLDDLDAQLEALGVRKTVTPATAERIATNLDTHEVPIQTLFAQKKALGELVYREGSPLNASIRVEELRAINRRMADFELEAIDRAAKEAGTPADGAALREARHTYQALSLAERAAEKTSAGAAKNNTIGLPDYLSAGMAAASGHLAVAPVIAMASKFGRMRADSLLAATFDRLSSLQAIAKKTAAVDSELNRGVKAFVSRAGGEAPKVRPREPVPERPASPAAARKAFDTTVKRLSAAAQGGNFAAPIAPLAKHAPNVAANFAASAQRATAWLLARVPAPPKFGSKTPSDQDVYVFNEEARAVENPAGTLANGLADGNLSTRQVDAIKATSPELFTSITKMVDARLEAAQASGKTLPWDVRRDVSLLFDIDTDWALTPAGGKVLQANATQDPQSSEQKPNRRSAPTTTPEATTMQTDVQRREGGQIR